MSWNKLLEFPELGEFIWQGLLQTRNALSCVGSCENCYISVKQQKVLRWKFSPVIIDIYKIGLLDTDFGFHFLSFYLTKMLHLWSLSSG